MARWFCFVDDLEASVNNRCIRRYPACHVCGPRYRMYGRAQIKALPVSICLQTLHRRVKRMHNMWYRSVPSCRQAQTACYNNQCDRILDLCSQCTNAASRTETKHMVFRYRASVVILRALGFNANRRDIYCCRVWSHDVSWYVKLAGGWLELGLDINFTTGAVLVK